MHNVKMFFSLSIPERSFPYLSMTPSSSACTIFYMHNLIMSVLILNSTICFQYFTHNYYSHFQFSKHPSNLFQSPLPLFSQPTLLFLCQSTLLFSPPLLPPHIPTTNYPIPGPLHRQRRPLLGPLRLHLHVDSPLQLRRLWRRLLQQNHPPLLLRHLRALPLSPRLRTPRLHHRLESPLFLQKLSFRLRLRNLDRYQRSGQQCVSDGQSGQRQDVEGLCGLCL